MAGFLEGIRGDWYAVLPAIWFASAFLVLVGHRRRRGYWPASELMYEVVGAHLLTFLFGGAWVLIHFDAFGLSGLLPSFALGALVISLTTWLTFGLAAAGFFTFLFLFFVEYLPVHRRAQAFARRMLVEDRSRRAWFASLSPAEQARIEADSEAAAKREEEARERFG